MSDGFPVERKWPWEIWTNYSSIISLYCGKNTYMRYNKSLCVQCNVVYDRYNVVQKISKIYLSCLKWHCLWLVRCPLQPYGSSFHKYGSSCTTVQLWNYERNPNFCSPFFPTIWFYLEWIFISSFYLSGKSKQERGKYQ